MRSWLMLSDTTPPPVPFQVRLAIKPNAPAELTWDAHADFESGLQTVVVERDGKPIGQVPGKPIGRFGRPLFPSMSYHDTPEKPLLEMKFLDKDAAPGTKHEYRVISINSVGLRSEAAVAKVAP